MNRFSLARYSSLLLFLLAGQPALAACSNCGPGAGDRLCGPKALLLICTRLGVAADLDELAELSHTDQAGATMAGLQEAAQHKGLQALGLKISASDLADCSTPAICYLWGNHFVLVEPHTGGLRVINPSADEPHQDISPDDFQALYSGFALLISRDALAAPPTDSPRPDLRLDAYSCDLGRVDEGTQITRTLTLRNVGDRDLTISQVRSSCTCLKAELINQSVPPGGSGTIALTLDTTGLRGVQTYAIYVQSDDPVSPLVQIQVAAAIKPATLLVSTRRIHFGDVDANLGAEREIFIKDPGDRSLDIHEVVSDSPLLQVCLVGASRPEGADVVFPVRLTLKPDLPVGSFEASITIVSNHPKEPRLRIPVFARIQGDIEVSPEALFLGFVRRGQAIRKSVTLRARTPRPFAIQAVSISPSIFSAEFAPHGVTRECTATVTLADAAPAGLIKGELHLHTDSSLQPTVTVPLHALVEDRREAAKDQPSREAARDPAGQGTVVRLFVFRSEGCAHCEVVDNDRMQAIAARVGCKIKVRYFDIEDMVNWRKLTHLERKYHDTDNEIPVVFIGADVFGGEQEVTAMLEPAIAMYAAEGGTAWPDEMDRGPYCPALACRNDSIAHVPFPPALRACHADNQPPLL